VDNADVLAVDAVRRRVRVSGQDTWAHLGNPFVLAAYATHKRNHPWSDIDLEFDSEARAVPEQILVPPARMLDGVFRQVRRKHR